MGYFTPPPNKSRQMQERYRKLRRRQQLLLLLAAVLGVVLLGLIGGGLWLLRGWRLTHRAAPPTRPTTAAAPLPKLAGELKLAQVRAVAFDGARAYVASDSQRRASTTLNMPLDTLSAYDLLGGKPAWETQLDTEAAQIGVAQGKLLLLRRYLSEPPRVELAAYNADNGVQAWEARIDGASRAGITIAGKVAIVAWLQNDGARICAYNIERGAKAWGAKLPLKALDHELIEGDSGEFELAGSGELTLYQLGNVAGVINNDTGKLIREHGAPGLLYGAQLDAAANCAYLLTAGADAGQFAVQALPLPKGAAVNVLRYDSADERGGIIYAENGYLLLCYAEAEAADRPAGCRLLSFARSQTGTLFDQRFAGLEPSDMAALPGGAGEFLVALNYPAVRGRSKGSQLFRLGSGATQLLEDGKLKSPVQYLARFGQHCLVLAQGGAIMNYDPGSGALKRIRRAAHPLLEYQVSLDGRRALITAIEDEQDASLPVAAMQALMFE